jgi:hypothetical protein
VPLRLAPRCLARTRSGTPCQKPAAKGKKNLFGAFPFLVKLYADAGYQGPQFQSAMKRILGPLTIRKRTGEPSPDRR